MKELNKNSWHIEADQFKLYKTELYRMLINVKETTTIIKIIV